MAASLAALFVAVYGPYGGNVNPSCGQYSTTDCGSGQSKVTNALLVTFIRPLWVMGLVGLSYLNFSNQAGVLGRFMSHPFWRLLSNVSYPMYLIHPEVLTLLISSQPAPSYFSVFGYVINYCGVVAVSILAAAGVVIFIEGPLQVLQKRYVWK